MNTGKLTFALAAVGIVAASASLAAQDPYLAETRAAIKPFVQQLKATLKGAMKSGGPVAAIEACNAAAPGIAEGVSRQYGWEIGRTSLKVRNPANAPDEWERKVLESFETRRQAGEPVASIEHGEIVETKNGKVYRYMKAIPTGKVCLRCHGTRIDPAVAEKLKQLYPRDQATGFRLGDIRGAFTITRPLD